MYCEQETKTFLCFSFFLKVEQETQNLLKNVTGLNVTDLIDKLTLVLGQC